MNKIIDTPYTELQTRNGSGDNSELEIYSSQRNYGNDSPILSGLEMAQSYSALVNENSEIINKTLDLASQITEVYGESQRLAASVEITKEKSKVELARIAAKFQLAKDVIEKSFAERSGVLSQAYNCLDHAIADGDKDMIIKVLHEIGSVVVTSPLSDIQNFIRVFDDKDQPLLDF